eukprot:CAMPEP_0171117942 /NCGR_PEP_ID=MMETSP0766_2-20121228/93626_1 /TAXON_ID=439317 /ORGANISM="Gambierdiscus australes, Strain CAWD 149" /LENGTH=146 /DNA_ID=CAMNT_0011580489 /DNA_START=21 /DNA_END=458 /DNA_ORIENTATION=-
MVAADGRVLKRTKQKNESGVKVKGEAEKSKIYLKWTKSSKRRIQRVGELEQTKIAPISNMRAALLRNTVEFKDSGEQAEGAEKKNRKPVVPFSGTVEDKFLTHKQERMLKRRMKMDTVRTDKANKKELKTPLDIRLLKKRKERKKV